LFYEITTDCAGCSMCAKRCPAQAITGERRAQHHIDPSQCKECGTCWRMCPKAAILDPAGRRRHGRPQKEMPRATINTDGCAGCCNCLLNCPFDAIAYRRRPLTIVTGLGLCLVDQAKCRGCTSCVAVCPTGAAAITAEGEPEPAVARPPVAANRRRVG
jgi:ferredoxin